MMREDSLDVMVQGDSFHTVMPPEMVLACYSALIAR